MNTETKLAIVGDTAVLRAVAADVTDIPSQVLPVLAEMRELMAAHNGVGLAAPQLGIGLRFFLMNESQGRHIAVINPEILRHGQEEKVGQEGCLSFPMRRTDVKRWTIVDVAYTNQDGKRVERTFRQFTARIFQHEFDHLNGTCIFP